MELNAEQIIKALECCKTTTPEDCIECPYRNKGNSLYTGCVNTLVKDTLSLIKELTEENKAWQKQLISTEEQAGKAYYDLACEVENLRAENERLHASCTELTQECKKWQGRVKIECDYTKADTVRKMQTELKKTFSALCKGKMNDLYRIIDQIAKEMLEGENEN